MENIAKSSDSEKVVSDKIAELRRSGERLRGDLRQLGSAALDLAGDKVDQTRGALFQTADDVRKAGQQQARRLEDQIKDTPFKSVLVAAAAGLLLGLLLSAGKSVRPD